MDEYKGTLSGTLFTLRLWTEQPGDDQIEWRGQLRHVLSGEVRNFRTWEGLLSCLEEMASLDRGSGEV